MRLADLFGRRNFPCVGQPMGAGVLMRLSPGCLTHSAIRLRAGVLMRLRRLGVLRLMRAEMH